MIVSPDADESPPTEDTAMPPANVEVAVDVALMDATTGVEVPTTLPEESVERRRSGFTLARLRVEPEARERVVPELKVNVPEVKLSLVSLLRNWDEVNPSKVVPRHVPDEVW